MSLPNNYNVIVKRLGGNPTNYIPVQNYRDFEVDVNSYYNQYYSTEQLNQQRRLYRNLWNNQQSINKFNKNPFINNNGIRYNFIYTYEQNYMVVENSKKNTTTLYIYMKEKNGWCTLGCFQNNKINCKEIERLIKNWAIKNYG